MCEWAAPGPFGQETCYSCAVACLRYLLHHLGLNYSEEELRHRLLEYIDPECLAEPSYSPEVYGYSDEALALLCDELGVRPCLRRTPGVGLWQAVPADWISPGSEAELADWLRQMIAAGRPVMVSLDVWRLLHPQLPPPGDYAPLGHSVVVTGMGTEVRFLDPDPADQPGYPKTGCFRSLPLQSFLDAWRANRVFCCSFAIEKRAP